MPDAANEEATSSTMRDAARGLRGVAEDLEQLADTLYEGRQVGRSFELRDLAQRIRQHSSDVLRGSRSASPTSSETVSD